MIISSFHCEQSANFQQLKMCMRAENGRIHAFKVVKQYLNKIETNLKNLKEYRNGNNNKHRLILLIKHIYAHTHSHTHTIYLSTLYQNHTALYEIRWTASTSMYLFFIFPSLLLFCVCLSTSFALQFIIAFALRCVLLWLLWFLVTLTSSFSLFLFYRNHTIVTYVAVQINNYCNKL